MCIKEFFDNKERFFFFFICITSADTFFITLCCYSHLTKLISVGSAFKSAQNLSQVLTILIVELLFFYFYTNYVQSLILIEGYFCSQYGASMDFWYYSEIASVGRSIFDSCSGQTNRPIARFAPSEKTTAPIKMKTPNNQIAPLLNYSRNNKNQILFNNNSVFNQKQKQSASTNSFRICQFCNDLDFLPPKESHI